jgi:hypothetical protein
MTKKRSEDHKVLPKSTALELMESDNAILKAGMPVKLFAEALIKELTEKGYNQDYAWRYAKAARSWCKKDSHDWNVWKEAERLTAPAE